MNLDVHWEPFALELEGKERRRVINAFVRFRGGTLSRVFLDTANVNAPVETGALRASNQPYVDEEPEAFSDNKAAPDYDPRLGSPARLTTKAKALLLSKYAGLDRKFGFFCGATYGSYVNDGTDKMAARPFWTAALAAANAISETAEESLLAEATR